MQAFALREKMEWEINVSSRMVEKRPSGSVAHVTGGNGTDGFNLKRFISTVKRGIVPQEMRKIDPIHDVTPFLSTSKPPSSIFSW